LAGRLLASLDAPDAHTADCERLAGIAATLLATANVLSVERGFFDVADALRISAEVKIAWI
jgi:hypothetical protein